MENRVHQIIEDALLLDFAETDAFDPEAYDYAFSEEFTERMHRIFVMADRQYVSVGRRRIRRAVALALAAALIMVTAACGVAVTKPLVKWLTSENEEQGALDIQFEIDDPNELTKGNFVRAELAIPKDYKIVAEQNEETQCYIEYRSDDSEIIYFSQSIINESMNMSIDNEAGVLKEIELNGNQGYEWSNGEFHSLTWSDGIYLFDIAGTCELEVLYQIAEEIR